MVIQGLDQLTNFGHPVDSSGLGGDLDFTQSSEVLAETNVASDPSYEKAKAIYDGRYGAGAYDRFLASLYGKAVESGSPSVGSIGNQLSISKQVPIDLVTDAKSYGELEGLNVDEQLNWLIQHDPDNATGWMESLIGLRAERENIQYARDYDKMMQDTKYQRAAKDLEAAGINPILAYQYVNGGNVSSGSAGYDSANVFSAETSRKSAKETKSVSAAATIIAALIAAMAMIGKALI